MTEERNDSIEMQESAPDADPVPGVVTKLSPRSVDDTVAAFQRS